MFETSVETEKLDTALAKAQAEIKSAAKDANNPAFKSKYADLASIFNACHEALAKHGVSVTQWPLHSTDGRLHLVTRLAFAGQWFRAEFSMPLAKQDAHGYGSATTYARRYSLAAAVGVVADEDDDGNGASGRGEYRSPPPVRVTSRPSAPVGDAVRDLEKQFAADLEKAPTIEAIKRVLSAAGAVIPKEHDARGRIRDLAKLRTATIESKTFDADGVVAVEGATS